MSFLRRDDWTIERLVILITLTNVFAALVIVGAATGVWLDFNGRATLDVFTIYVVCAVAVLGLSLAAAKRVATAISAPITELAEAVGSMRSGQPPALQRVDMPVELRALSSALSLAFEERQAALQKVQSLAHYDAVTGAFSRAYFDHRARNLLQILMRENQPATLLYIDLDRFKHVNDDHGHDAGDLLLQGVVTRTRQRMRSVDLIGRRGGDEFLVFLPNMADPDAIAGLAGELALLITAPMDVGEATLAQVGVSMGAAIFPDQARSYDALVSCADRAMYEAKKAGGARLAAFGQIVELLAVESLSP